MNPHQIPPSKIFDMIDKFIADSNTVVNFSGDQMFVRRDMQFEIAENKEYEKGRNIPTVQELLEETKVKRTYKKRK